MRHINELFSIWIMLFLIVPAIKAPFMGNYYRFIMVIGIFGWFGTAAFTDSSWLIRPRKTLFLVMLLNIFYVLLAIMNVGDISGNIIIVLSFWIPFYIYDFYSYLDAKESISRLIKVALLCIVSVVLSTLYYAISDPYLIRTVFKDGAESIISYYRLNIGDLGFVYALELMLTIGVMFFSVRVLDGALVKVLTIAFLSLSFGVIFNSSSGFMMIGLLIILFLFLFYRNNGTNRVVFIIGMAIVLILVIPMMQSILNNLAAITENIFYKEKLVDFANTLQFGVNSNNSGSTASRLFAYRTDLTSFINHPLFGVGAYYIHNDSVGLNGHSSLFGDMARYGFFFLIFMLYLFRQIRKDMISIDYDYRTRQIVNATFIMFWFQYIINPVSQEAMIGWVMWFVLPGLLKLLKKDTDETEDHME